LIAAGSTLATRGISAGGDRGLALTLSSSARLLVANNIAAVAGAAANTRQLVDGKIDVLVANYRCLNAFTA